MVDIWSAIEWLVFGAALLAAQRYFVRKAAKREVARLRTRCEAGDYGFTGVRPEMLDLPETEEEWKEAEREMRRS